MKTTEAWQLEKHLPNKQIRPVKKVDYKGLGILLAEGGPHYNDPEFPIGYYESAFFLQRDEKVLFGQVLQFSMAHDIHMSDSQRQEARINSALKLAQETIDGAYENVTGSEETIIA